MAISPRLDLRQSQSLVMTPQLQQAIKLLQLSNVELLAYVEDELLRNPMLEREEGGAEAPDDGSGTEPRVEADAERMDDGFGDEATSPDMVELAAAGNLPPESDGPLDLDAETVWTEDGPSDRPEPPEPISHDRMGAGTGGRTDFSDNDGNLEATISEQPTLRDHLMAQLVVDLSDPIERMIGIQLIEALDEAGWLSEDLEQIAQRLNCPIERVAHVLDVVQRFDPPGLFARTLKECLALQLRDRDRLDPAMQAMLDNLELVARHDKAALLKVCGVDEEDLADMVAELRSLDPKPG